MHLSCRRVGGSNREWPDTRVGVEIGGLASGVIMKGNGLDKANRHKEEGKDGLGQHIEG